MKPFLISISFLLSGVFLWGMIDYLGDLIDDIHWKDIVGIIISGFCVMLFGGAAVGMLTFAIFVIFGVIK